MPVPSGALCPRHPTAPAIAACRRCGTFVCGSDQVLLEGAVFCGDCAARPDVDYLEAFRQKYWGKRDSWAWFFGIGAVANVAAGLGVLGAATVPRLEKGGLLIGAALLAWSVAAAAFWWGARWARPAMVAVVLLYAVAQTVLVGPTGLAAVVFPLALVASTLSNVRAKLFFKLDVPREQLKKAWAVLHDNVAARNALTLGVAGLGMGVFAPFAVLLGIIGLRRVDPTAYPPIGRKGQAIAGIVLGALGTLAWGTFAAAMFLDSR
ncbi:MAG: DUF4190 domain-containing protein [Myxococcales bacterium]|nr:DUF4190 domain-containing protein [Myxococcales bacterium]